MANNTQAANAGLQADEIIKNLANPKAAIVTPDSTIEVLDTATPVQPQQVAEQDWEKRFKNYKGSTDKTLHTLRQQVTQFDLLNEDNESLKKQLEETKAQIPQTTNEMLELFSEEEVAGMEKMFGGKVSGLQNEVERLQAALDKVQETEAIQLAQKSHQSIVEQVKAAVPNYEAIDTDPAFVEWINDTDDFGNIRYEMLIAAKRRTPPDIGRLVQFYVEFANSNTKPQEEATKQYTQQELLQTPDSTPVPGVSTPQSKGIVWDQPTISQFYKDKATGKINPKLAKELEEDMYASMKRR